MNEMFKNFKLTDRDKFLLTVFIVCCVLLVWVVGDLIVHSRTVGALASDYPVGMAIAHPTLIDGEWMTPDGRCLSDTEYADLSKALHGDKNDWAYGRCDDTHFRLPNLLDQNNYTPFKIKVK